jgi:IS605 OrfB family transposase
MFRMQQKKCLQLPVHDLTIHKQQLLKETYKEFLNLINEHRAVAGRANTDTELHHLTYRDMREKYSGASAQLIEQARRIAWKTRKQGRPEKCSVRFDKRLFSMSNTKRGNPILSLRLAKKRIGLPIVLYQRIKDHIEQGWKLTSMIMTGRLEFYLIISKESLSIAQTESILGIDVNSSKIAVSITTTSGAKMLRQLYLGKHIGSKQYEFEERRAKLQQYRDTTTPSKAGLKLKRLSGKQRRYVRTNIWTLANEIVKLAKKYNSKIAIEALKNLRRKKDQLSRKSRRKVNRIPYGLLKHCLMSVCAREGGELVLVDPKYTSQECQKCRHTSKKNWIGYKLFRCQKCGFECNRDRNASVNIAARASLLFSHPEQMPKKTEAQVSGGDPSVNRDGLKGEGSVESSESVTYPSFRLPDKSGSS